MRTSREIKRDKVKALKQAGLPPYLIKEFEKSSAEVMKVCQGRLGKLITKELLDKCYELIEKRKEIGVEVAGMIFEDTMTVTFIYYVDENPEDALFERDIFFSVEDFEKELDFQLCENYIPDMSGQKRIIYQEGMYLKVFGKN